MSEHLTARSPARDVPAPRARVERMSATVGNRTLASRLAHEIEQEIIRREWPVGEGLGSESALMERYQVGRSVLREAVRILESRWVAKPRPGPGGGLVVTAPDPDGVRDVTRMFLDFAQVRPAHLYQAWMALEVVAVRELAASIDADGIARLREAVRAERACATVGPPADQVPARVGTAACGPAARRFTPAAADPNGYDLGGPPPVDVHLEIVRLAGNPAIDLFVRVLVDLAPTRGEALVAPTGCGDHETHTEIVEAIIGGDAAVAQHHVRRCIQRLAEADSPAAAHAGTG